MLSPVSRTKVRSAAAGVVSGHQFARSAISSSLNRASTVKRTPLAPLRTVSPDVAAPAALKRAGVSQTRERSACSVTRVCAVTVVAPSVTVQVTTMVCGQTLPTGTGLANETSPFVTSTTTPATAGAPANATATPG